MSTDSDSFEIPSAGEITVETLTIPAGGSVIASCDFRDFYRALSDRPAGLVSYNTIAAVDPTNISTFEDNISNNNFTDLVYHNSSAGSANQELPGIDLGASVPVDRLRITWWNSNTYGSNNYNIQGSNDATTWTDVATGLSTGPNVAGTGVATQQEVVIFAETTFRYWRIFNVTGRNATWMVLSEMSASYFNPTPTPIDHVIGQDVFTYRDDGAGNVEVFNQTGQPISVEVFCQVVP